MRTRVGVLGLVLLCITGCTTEEQTGRPALNTDPVSAEGPEICTLLPRPSLAHVTARAEDTLTSIGDIELGPDSDRGQCEVVTADGASWLPVASLRIETGQLGDTVRVNNAIEVAKDRSARGPLPNPLRTGLDTSPVISLAIRCGARPVLIGLDVTGYDLRRNAVDKDMEALATVVAQRYGEQVECDPELAPPLPEDARGTVRALAGNGSREVPTTSAQGTSTPIGHIEALTTTSDGSVYVVSRRYEADVNPRSVGDGTDRWGRTLRLLRIRTTGVVDVVWDPNRAPFSTKTDPVPGDIAEGLRLQGRDTTGSVSAIVMHDNEAWLVPAGPETQAGNTLNRPVRIVQLAGGRAVDLRAIKAPVAAGTTRITDPAGRLLPDPLAGAWNAARFTAVGFDGPTPVLLDGDRGQVWRIEGIRDGKILDATIAQAGVRIATGSSAAGLNGGRFAVSTSQGGFAILDSRGRVQVTTPVVSADIDGVGPGPVELGRRQFAAAGDDVLVHAVSSRVRAPVVIRVNSRTGTMRTLQVSGYPGERDQLSDVEATRFSRSYGTAANATRLFATGWPVAAMGAFGSRLLLAPFGTRVLYELTPKD